jgi:hypothetical protein
MPNGIAELNHQTKLQNQNCQAELLPFWQCDLPIPIAFSFAFVGGWFWICHFGSLICKKMKLPFDLTHFVSIGNLISVKKFDLLTQLRFIFAR